jgi:hypothetical protein
LAERFGDFRSLVELCNDPHVGSPARLQFFLEKYREAFATVLYQWYIEKGMSFVLKEGFQIDLASSDERYRKASKPARPGRDLWRSVVELFRTQSKQPHLLASRYCSATIFASFEDSVERIG